MADVKEEKTEKLKLLLERQTESFKLSLACTEDKLRLFLDATPTDLEKTKELTAENLIVIIEEIVPKDKIDTNVLASIAKQLANGEVVTKRRVAKGKEAVEGRDGRCVLLVKTYKEPKSGETVEVVDQRFIRFFDNIEKGAPIGRVYPPTPGTDGTDIYGNVIKAAISKPVKISPDKTITLKADDNQQGFQTLVANESGYLSDKAGKLSIQSELVIDGDVDFRTGDIDFICKVIVKKSVMKGFTIKAGGDIEVHGNVVGGTVISRSGSVRVKGRVLGERAEEVTVSGSVSAAVISQAGDKFHAIVRAANIFSADSVEHADVEAECDIEVKNEARDSSLWTKGLVRIEKGHLFGGKTYSACGLEAKILGTASGAKTAITLSSDVEATKYFLQLLRDIKQTQDIIDTCNLYLGPIVKNPERIATLTATHRKKTEQLLQRLNTAQAAMTTLMAEKEKSLIAARRNTKLRVNIHSECHSGVTVTVGEHTFTSMEKIAGPRTIEYNSENGSFEIVELRNLECVVPDHCALP